MNFPTSFQGSIHARLRRESPVASVQLAVEEDARHRDSHFAISLFSFALLAALAALAVSFRLRGRVRLPDARHELVCQSGPERRTWLAGTCVSSVKKRSMSATLVVTRTPC